MPSAERMINGSNMCSITLALVVMFWKCGSMEVGGLLIATLKSWAMAGKARQKNKTAAANSRRAGKAVKAVIERATYFCLWKASSQALCFSMPS